MTLLRNLKKSICQLDKNKIIKNIFTILIILFPLFSMYKFFGTRISIADFFAILFILYITIFDFSKENFKKIYLIITSYVFISCIVVVLSNNFEKAQYIDLIGSTIKVLMIFYLASINGKYFNKELAKKSIIIVSVICTIYLFIQFILAKFGIFLGGGIPIFEYFRPDVTDYVNNSYVTSKTYRPRTLFEEPAHYCQYIVVAISLLLYDTNYKKTLNSILIVFLSLGVCLSMSLIGWIFLGIVILFYIFNKVNKKYLIAILSIGVATISLLLTIFWESSVIQNVFVKRFVDSNIFSDERFESYRMIPKMFDVDVLAFLFGHGFIESEIAWVGLVGVYYYFGFFGYIIFIVFSITILRKYFTTQLNKNLFLLILLALIGTDFVFGKFILINSCFINYDSIILNKEIKYE